MIQDMILKLVAENWMLGALIIGGIAVIGMVLGSLKRGASTLLSASLNSGDRLVTRLLEKPRAIALFSGVAGLVVPSCLLTYYLSPPKILEKVVIRTINVSDDTEIRRLQGELTTAEEAKQVAERELSDSRTQYEQLQTAKQQADQMVAGLSDQVRKLTPPTSDAAEMRRLDAEIDVSHEEGAERDPNSRIRNPDPRADFDLGLNYREYKTVRLRGPYRFMSDGINHVYHRNCSICERNIELRKAMDVIYARHPKWGLADWRHEE